MNNKTYKSALIIGMGLIGSSIARVIRQKKIADKIFAIDNNEITIGLTKKLDIVDDIYSSLEAVSDQFNLIFICTPLSQYKNIFNKLNTFVEEPTLITDVGSTKLSVVEDFKSIVNNDKISFLPAHPIAGLEKSGPEYGFAELFDNRYCIITPS